MQGDDIRDRRAVPSGCEAAPQIGRPNSGTDRRPIGASGRACARPEGHHQTALPVRPAAAGDRSRQRPDGGGAAVSQSPDCADDVRRSCRRHPARPSGLRRWADGLAWSQPANWVWGRSRLFLLESTEAAVWPCDGPRRANGQAAGSLWLIALSCARSPGIQPFTAARPAPWLSPAQSSPAGSAPPPAPWR